MKSQRRRGLTSDLLILPAVFDVLFLAIALVMLLLFADELSGDAELLTALHFLHIVALVPALVILVPSVRSSVNLLYKGIYFIIVSVSLAVLDLVIILTRVDEMRTNITDPVGLFLSIVLYVFLFLDVAFFVTSLLYLGIATNNMTDDDQGSSSKPEEPEESGPLPPPQDTQPVYQKRGPPAAFLMRG